MTVSAKPRLGIVLTEFGIPSEVWALRQAEAMSGFEPVYFATTQRDGGLEVPAGRELHLFGDAPLGLGRKIARKLGRASGGLPAPQVLAAMKKALTGANLDLILCHFAWNGAAVVAAIGDAVPVVCHAHGRDVTANLRWPANKQALARALPQFADVITVGSHQIEALREVWSDAASHLIPCGAPLERFAGAPVPRRGEAAPIIFTSVGRLSQEKGLFQTFEAFETTCAAGHDARLIYVGDGPLRGELEAKIAGSGLAEKVEMRGLQTPEQIAQVLSQSHVFLQHSLPVGGWIEGFGVTLTEAGAAGLPLIATRSGGIPDQVFEAENGFLVEPWDVEAQARAMIRLAQDEDQRVRMGQAARNVAGRFDSALMAAALQQVLMRVVSE